MNDIEWSLEPESEFVPADFRHAGEENIRDAQLAELLGRNTNSYRQLTDSEIHILREGNNQCDNWGFIWVSAEFDPQLIRNCTLAGMLRIGKIARSRLSHHDIDFACGITNSRLVDCDIGDYCAIHNCAYIAHYIIGDSCILFANGEIHCSNHAKFGNGIVKEGEHEKVRIQIDLMNESGGRSILPFRGLTCADAYLWARKRDDTVLMSRLADITNASCSARRGFYGSIGSHSVLKHNKIIKDVAVGESCYIKGANKLKNLTIDSTDSERTQIGEGVELVNGIISRGCQVFYGCKAIRFVMCQNSSLKYGARLIHSVLGDNSTVSCCEILNNLIFPGHEQHHNTSFLIASFIGGQSNLAAGSTIGSNHNSRMNDEEIRAGRGFWTGLSTSAKHPSRFASFCLLAKGSYQHELDITFPFCLVGDDKKRDALVLMPAYWWTSNMYALMRFESKLRKRDRRQTIVQHIEYSPFAPDTAEEIIPSINILQSILNNIDNSVTEVVIPKNVALSEKSHRQVFLHKPERALDAYLQMLEWYGALSVFEYVTACAPRISDINPTLWQELDKDRITAWENLGGHIAPKLAVDVLVERIKSGKLDTWAAIHQAYDELWQGYGKAKAAHGIACLRLLADKSFRRSTWKDPVTGTVAPLATSSAQGTRLSSCELARSALEAFPQRIAWVIRRVTESREKDYRNPFRARISDTEAEMRAVHGSVEHDKFLASFRTEMGLLAKRVESFLQ